MSSNVNRLLISLLAALSLPALSQTTALTNINVIDVTSMSINKNQTIVIDGDRIKKVISANKVKLDKDAVIVDMAGKYAMPGLIDTHVHHATDPDGWDNDQITRKRLQGLLRGGVTSVRDMGGDNRALASLKRRAEIDVIQSPDIYYSVIIGGKEFFSDPRTVSSAKGRKPGQVDWMRAVDDKTNLDEVMLKALGTGASGIKIYAKVDGKLVAKLSKYAKKHGLKVWSHVFIGPSRPMETIKAGVETVSHASDMSAHVVKNFYELRRKGENISQAQKEASFETSRYQNLLNAMKRQDTIFDPTLTVFALRNSKKERDILLWGWSKLFTKLVHEKGIKIAAGTDGASDMYNIDYPLVHKEMDLLVSESGLSPLSAIRSATQIGAEVIGIEKDYGALEAGKKANIVILNNDPSEDITQTINIAHVLKNGEFVYRGDNPQLPFVAARKSGNTLWLSGNIGNIPTTKTLAGDSLEVQMKQTMKNLSNVLLEHDLDFSDVVKCTLMLDDINDWQKASEIYKKHFKVLPARSAFAASGLALNAKVELDCVAAL